MVLSCSGRFKLACLWRQNLFFPACLWCLVKAKISSSVPSVSDMYSNSRYATQQPGLLVTQDLQSISFHGLGPIDFTLGIDALEMTVCGHALLTTTH